MTTTDKPRLERDILADAAAVFAVQDELTTALREAEERLQTLCAEYSAAKRLYGYAPHHLRRAVDARGLT
jgi:hypothetical protein